MKLRKQSFQYAIILAVNVLTLICLALYSKKLVIQSIPAAVGVSLAFSIVHVIYWWLFLNSATFLPIWLFPLLSLVLSGSVFMLLSNLVPGVVITNLPDSLRIMVILTLVNGGTGGLLSLDVERVFDRHVTLRLFSRLGSPHHTQTPGFLYLEIDGLSEKVFRRALADGKMPLLKSWLDEGTHRIMGWETGFSSQTCAMQAGILYGKNDDIPSYRWWDRQRQRVVVSGYPNDAAEIERQLTHGTGLLAQGGASRGNMFSGDASESLFTISTFLDRMRKSAPVYYLGLVSPFFVGHLITRFIQGVFKEWWQALVQKFRKDRYQTQARSPWYAFMRAAIGPLLQEITTLAVIGDVLRGLPAVYALFAEYDDIAHFAGEDTPEAFQALRDVDNCFSRIVRTIKIAPRPYQIVILSDHGQSTGPTFKSAYGITLDDLVRNATRDEPKIYTSLETNEEWYKINALINETISGDTRASRVLSTLLASRTQEGVVTFGYPRNPPPTHLPGQDIVVLASGCTGLIYLTGQDHRVSYEELQARYPDLLPALMLHPGIGFLLVRSGEHGNLIFGKTGIRFLDLNTIEGEDPLKDYSPHAAEYMQRISRFSNCPDMLVNTRYDPVTEEISSFEDQVSHHGGLGGDQNHPFIFYPVGLGDSEKEIVEAPGVYTLLSGWRNGVEGK